MSRTAPREATRDDGPTAGRRADAARTLTHHAVVGRGPASFEAAAAGLLTWQMHASAGVRAEAADGTGSARAAEPGVRVAVGVGPRVLGLRGVCVVERVVHGADRVALTYRTEPGHAEDGVQTFEVALDPDGVVRARITSTSAPAHAVLRAMPFLGRFGQSVVARRYLRALRRLAAAG